VGPNGKVKASVKAREVVVLGTIHGDVETSDKIEIRKDAKLVGDIKTARIGIEDGAYFKGNIDIIRPDTRPAANGQKSQAVPSTPPSVNSPAMAAGASGSSGPSSLGPTEVKR
jgi:cytoskeletal protein CcmA (bactofilin family)